MSESAAAFPNRGLPVAEVVGILKEIIRELGVPTPAAQIDEHAPLLEDGIGLDSVVLVQMIGLIEDRLSMQFRDADLRVRTFSSLRTVAEVVCARLTEASPGPKE